MAAGAGAAGGESGPCFFVRGVSYNTASERCWSLDLERCYRSDVDVLSVHIRCRISL